MGPDESALMGSVIRGDVRCGNVTHLPATIASFRTASQPLGFDPRLYGPRMNEYRLSRDQDSSDRDSATEIPPRRSQDNVPTVSIPIAAIYQFVQKSPGTQYATVRS